ncbi:leucine_Rich Repeat (LRR)-containing protein [Hexamita inflata]|uniref:Leucine Rich Repeat (LRR)-containing protein n=1 Tax=Hexamita inflata TaxID=28002 RepID=A0AA86UYN5_9EUKA|nr:leucine Rich Repeat (LRR)-containing protein [Hexamita inflata]
MQTITSIENYQQAQLKESPENSITEKYSQIAMLGYDQTLINFFDELQEEDTEIRFWKKDELKDLYFVSLCKPSITKIVVNQCRNINFNKVPNQIVELIVNGCKLACIEGIQNMISLTVLDLSNNELSDLTPLSNMEQLTVLLLNKNRISSLIEISQLKQLKILDVGNNSIQDIKVLSNFQNLEELNISTNQITRIDSLSQVLSLKCLKLKMNKIEDFTPIKSLPHYNISWIELQNVQLKSSDEYDQLMILKYRNQIDGDKLEISNSLVQLTSLGFINTFNEVKNLTIKCCPHINFIKIPTNVTQLTVSNFDAKFLSGIGKMVQLTYLNIENNKIENIDELQFLVNLTFLSIKGNSVKSIQNIPTQIASLDLTENPITDYTQILNFNNLRHLRVSASAYLQPVQQHKNFKDVWIVEPQKQIKCVEQPMIIKKVKARKPNK